MANAVPIVDYLVLGDDPHLVAKECTSCQARFFDRRNACASCFATEFKDVSVATSGELKAFTIVAFAAPGVPVPFVAGVNRAGAIAFVRTDGTVAVLETDGTIQEIAIDLPASFLGF